MNSFSSGKSIISKERIEVTDGATSIPVGAATPHKSNSRINVIREGEKVEAIEVTCDCGKTTRIVCDY